jgi:hypothetical protein
MKPYVPSTKVAGLSAWVDGDAVVGMNGYGVSVGEAPDEAGTRQRVSLT